MEVALLQGYPSLFGGSELYHYTNPFFMGIPLWIAWVRPVSIASMCVWVCGCVGVWVCGCVGVWVCGCVGECVCVCGVCAGVVV